MIGYGADQSWCLDYESSREPNRSKMGTISDLNDQETRIEFENSQLQ